MWKPRHSLTGCWINSCSRVTTVPGTGPVGKSSLTSSHPTLSASRPSVNDPRRYAMVSSLRRMPCRFVLSLCCFFPLIACARHAGRQQMLEAQTPAALRRFSAPDAQSSRSSGVVEALHATATHRPCLRRPVLGGQPFTMTMVIARTSGGNPCHVDGAEQVWTAGPRVDFYFFAASCADARRLPSMVEERLIAPRTHMM